VLVKVLFLLAGASTVALGLYWYLTFPDVTALAKDNPRTTAFIETRAKEAREQGRSIKRRWIWIPLSRVSPHLQRAVIVSEDASFYQHHGFDWDGMRDAAERNWEGGELRRGGSTITQQLAKNLYLSPEKSYMRKIHEAIITRVLEKRLTKKRILELYLNVVEWGRGIYGAEAAARHHFGKSARDLEPEEAALLAAILPSPRRYDPLRVTRFLAKRQQQILRSMQEGRIHAKDGD
jgi:monofunctional biosynthetic peptidoglycan transglycosylase